MTGISMVRRLGAGAAALTVCGGLAVGVAQARSDAHHSQCSPSAGATHPVVLTPCAGATISVANNHNFTVKVRVSEQPSDHYIPFLYISRGGSVRHGLFLDGANGIDVKMKRVPGHSDEYYYDTKSLPDYNYPGFWRVTSGTYRMQVQQISDAGTLGSPIEKLHFRA